MKHVKLLIGILFCIVLSSCTSARVNYVGHSYRMTKQVDIYYDEKNITHDYEIMGQAVGSCGRIDNVEKTLVERAKKEGADAILITNLGNSYNAEGVSGVEVNASFIKY